MIQVYSRIEDIDELAWGALVERSEVATWFQTLEAYRFYAAVPQEMVPFVYAVTEEEDLVGVVVGYITHSANTLKQYLTRRAIIIGGPLLDTHITTQALTALLDAVRKGLQHKAIYIETRNFHDYSPWRHIFEQCGFTYQPHLNFQVDTTTLDIVEQNLGKSRKRDIRTTIREGVEAVMQPTMEQVREYYGILQRLYATKVKTPLFSWAFFEQLYKTENGHFFLTVYQGHVIGGTVCVSLPKKGVYEWFVCGEDGQYEHIFPSSYATYLGITYTAKNNYPLFDMMGAGKPDEAYGVRDFKARFGGKQVEHGRYLCIYHPLLYKVGTLGVKILKKK